MTTDTHEKRTPHRLARELAKAIDGDPNRSKELVAAHLQKSVRAVERWLTGEHLPSAGDLRLVADLLELDYEHLRKLRDTEAAKGDGRRKGNGS